MEHCKISKIPEDEVGRILREEFTDDFRKNFILVGEENTCFAEEYLNYAEDIRKFEVRDSDVIVASYPKTGTTWTQEMVWLIMNNLDYKGAEIEIVKRFPFLEACTLTDWEKMDEAFNRKTPDFIKKSVEFVNRQPNPRFIKTHLPFYLLPNEIQSGQKLPKIIYIMRNPKDTCVSYYHHSLLLQRSRTNLENFVKVFLADKALYGSFWKHVIGYWEQRDLLNMLIIHYEDMKKDLPSSIRKVAKFLGRKLTEEELEVLTGHLSFESMKNNKAVNAEGIIEIRRKLNLVHTDQTFIRSGTVGKFKEEMSPEMIEAVDQWTRKNIDGTDFGKQYNYDF